MSGSTRTTILVSVLTVLLVLLGVWWYFGFSLEFTKFFAAEPQTTAPAQTEAPTPTPNPSATVVCSPASQTVSVGATATLTASGGSGSYTWYAFSATPSTPQSGSSFSVSYDQAGAKEVLLSGPRADGISTDIVSCTVIVQ